jgi:hypothetical protein
MFFFAPEEASVRSLGVSNMCIVSGLGLNTLLKNVESKKPNMLLRINPAR